MSLLFDSKLEQSYVKSVRKYEDSKYAELRETFEIFDKDGDGIISFEEFSTVVKCVNHDLTDEKVMEMLVNTAGHDGKFDGLDFPSFCNIMESNMKALPAETDQINAFKVFDKKNTGFIDSIALKHFMSTLASDLTPDEVGKMIKTAKPNSKGQINYKEWAKSIFSKATD